MRVRGAGGGRVSIAGVACFRPGDRPHLFYKLLAYRRRKGEAKGFTWMDYRDLIIITHRQLAAPLIWCWDNLNIHLAPELAGFAKENAAWLRIYRLPAYAPDLNPAEMSLPQCELRRFPVPWLPGSYHTRDLPSFRPRGIGDLALCGQIKTLRSNCRRDVSAG